MNISSIPTYDYSQSTCHFFVEDSNSAARSAIREHFEKEHHFPYLGMDSTADFNRLMLKVEEAQRKQSKCKQTYLDTQNQKVDIDKLKQLGYFFSKEIRRDELYAGGCLNRAKNGIQTAKDAGIKSVVALIGKPLLKEYEEESKKVGLNFVCLEEIGEGKLNCFSIIPRQIEHTKLISELVNHPEIWATQEPDGKPKENVHKQIESLQKFIDILDGKNKNFPQPVYFGCEWGEERTAAWLKFYDIMRNADRTKPLCEDKIKELLNFEAECWDEFD